MHKKLLIGLAALAAALLAGCGGGGAGAPEGPDSLSTTRTLVGYVYVKSPSSPNAGEPDVIVTAASTPPQYYDVPTKGTVSLLVEGGKFMVKPTGTNNEMMLTKDLSTGHDIVVTVATEGGTKIQVMGSGISAVGASQILTGFEIDLKDGNANGTTFNVVSPNNPDKRVPNKTTLETVKFSLDGQTPGDPTTLEAGQSRYLGLAFLDAEGISVPGIPAFGGGVRITSDSPKIGVDNQNNLLIPATKGQHSGPVTITAELASPATVSGSLNFTFTYGTSANLLLFKKTDAGNYVRLDDGSAGEIAIRWEVDANPRPSNLPNSVRLAALVTNKYGAGIPDETVYWTDPKVYPTTHATMPNEWRTSVGGAAFVDEEGGSSQPTSVSDLDGYAEVTFQAPNPAPPGLSGRPGDLYNNLGEGDQSVKGPNLVVATADSGAVAQAGVFFLTRQLESLRLAESSTSVFRHVNVQTRVPYTAMGVDVDDWESRDVAVAKFRVNNLPGGAKVGDLGERELAAHISPRPIASMDGGYLVTGSLPGQVEIEAYTTTPSGADDLSSEPYLVNIWGPPTQIVTVYRPAVNADSPWTEGKYPHRVVPFDIPASELRVLDDFVPNKKEDPDAYVCYLYLRGADKSGSEIYRQLPDTEEERLLYGQTVVLPAGDEGVTATWYNPKNIGSCSLPGDPTGLGGEQCLIMTIPILQYPPEDNGKVTIRWTGQWGGIGPSDTPRPTNPIAFDITRVIRIKGAG